MNPENLSYTKDHEWLLIKEGVATLGITDYAQEELGDIVFAELPAAGTRVSAGDSPVTLESVKAVSSVYTPVAGEITEVNERLSDEPEIINSDPFGEGWIFRIRLETEAAEGLMNSADYEKYLESLE